jgi:uncharacterized membrane protein YbhN (UPF0104 family)
MLRSPHFRRIAGIVLAIAVIAATFVFILPRVADYGEVWGHVKELSWAQIGALVLATALNLVTYGPPWTAALPGLRYRNALVLSLSTTASTFIAPGGPAVGVALSYGMLRAWGFAGRAVALAVTMTGIWNQFAMLAFPSIALGLLTIAGEKHRLLQTVAIVGGVIFVAAAGAWIAGLSSKRLARWAGNLSARIATRGLRRIGREPASWTGETFATFRAESVGLVRRRWHYLTAATLAGHLSVFVVLLVCLRVFGVHGEVSVIEAFAAWSLVRLLGSIPITPGGLGVVELGLTTALVGFGGDNSEVVTAVLTYRFLTIVPTLVLGLILGATWRRHQPALEPEPVPEPEP